MLKLAAWECLASTEAANAKWALVLSDGHIGVMSRFYTVENYGSEDGNYYTMMLQGLRKEGHHYSDIKNEMKVGLRSG